MLGGFDSAVPCYAGGIDLEFPLEALLKQTDDNLGKGFRAIKMKVGRAAAVGGPGAGAGDAGSIWGRFSADGGCEYALDGGSIDYSGAGVPGQ